MIVLKNWNSVEYLCGKPPKIGILMFMWKTTAFLKLNNAMVI